MPIDQAEWNQGKPYKTIESQILDFLVNNRGKAFTEPEVTASLELRREVGILGLLADSSDALLTYVTLENLIREGKVKASKIGEHAYFMAV